MIYSYDQIRHVHLEISSECNAACPQCPRNFHGFPMNHGYPERSMTLAEAQKIFDQDFIGQLHALLINGNFGDIVMCQEGADIVEYFRSHNSGLKIEISTNGGARGEDFWQRLALTGSHVFFCIDGLEDTHAIYRQNTSYRTILKNARTFIQAGGTAIWKFIVFDHNEHQIEQARLTALEMGFSNFVPVYGRRTHGPVFDRNKKMIFHLGGDRPQTSDLDLMLSQARVVKGGEYLPKKSAPIDCKVQKESSIYITSNGEVYPCCWLGHSPMTFNQIEPWITVNPQIAKLITRNNALQHDLKQCIGWFDQVANSWHRPDYTSGLLYQCVNVCGQPA